MIFAAPRASDVPELVEIQTMFSSKYGPEFTTAAAELLPDCHVNRLVSFFDCLTLQFPVLFEKNLSIYLA